MPATVSIRAQFSYDPVNLRYRRLANGRYASARAVKREVNRIIKRSQEEMTALAEQVAKRQITIRAFRDRFAAELKNLHVSGAMAGAGGMGNMTPADYGRVGAELRFQYERLAKFARDVKARQLTADQINSRAALYVAGMNKTYERARRDKAIESGVMAQERNILGAVDRHCHECLALSARGWVPIGTLPAPGERICLQNCRCRLAYRKRRQSAALV